MPGTQIRTVAVIGGGPAGSAVATYLARKGLRVALFQRGKRPPIIVGESLVPAIVPFLRKLGVEDEVRGFSTFKPGASFTFDLERQQSFRFDEVRNGETSYSYNVPRGEFDAALLKAAVNAGAQLFDFGAVVERDAGERIRLSDATLSATDGFLTGPPDFVVDATGRTRTVARLLELRTVAGPRRDTALHAHLEGVPLLFEGNVHSDRLERGWAWRIPLPGRVSVGLVVPSEHLRRFGEDPESQYDGLLRSDPITAGWAPNAKRLTPVIKYTNYQLRTERGAGPGWALVGDAFGFVDPIFSSGMLIGMQGAESLAAAIVENTPQAFARYERQVLHALTIWQRLADYFYDGRLFTLFQVSEYVRQTWFGRLVDFHMRAHLPRIFTGEGTTSRYNVALLDFMIKHGLAGNDPRELEVS
jgi:flavin-dependent dehydrogenase